MLNVIAFVNKILESSVANRLFLCATFVPVAVLLLLSCAPSIIQHSYSKPFKVGYEINLNPESETRRYAVKIADSMVLANLKKLVREERDLSNNYFKINLQELKWYCPDRQKIEAEGFAIGLAGGLVGGAVWGEQHTTTVYGVCNTDISVFRPDDTLSWHCLDTISFVSKYNDYSTIETRHRTIIEVFEKTISCLFSFLNAP